MSRRGFSLIESIVTLFVVLLVLGLAADLVKEYSSVLNFSAGKESTLMTTQVGLQRMVDECRESISLQSPTGPAATDLRFQRIDPAYTSWLPTPYDPATSTPPASWNPYPAASLLRVRYYVANAQLLRTVTYPSSSVTTEVVAASITALQTSGPTLGRVQIQLSCQESQKITVLTTTVLRPVP